MRTLNDVYEMFGDRQIVVARELTKKFEEIIRGKASFVIDHFRKHRIRGEFVLIIDGCAGTNLENG